MGIRYDPLDVFWPKILDWRNDRLPKLQLGTKSGLDFLNRFGCVRRVVGACNANDTMLRRSDQLLLAAENHHFEGNNTYFK